MNCPWCNTEIKKVRATVHTDCAVEIVDGKLELSALVGLRITELGVLQYCWCSECGKGLYWNMSEFIRYNFASDGSRKKQIKDNKSAEKALSKLSLKELQELLAEVQNK